MSNKLIEDKTGRERFVGKFGKELADKFFSFKSRLNAPLNDISFWLRKNKDAEDLEEILNELASVSTRKQKDDTARRGSNLIYSDEDWSVYEILNVAASIKYGRGTKWCISSTHSMLDGSGEDVTAEDMLDTYKRLYGEGIPENSKFYFYISKLYSDKYAVVINTVTNAYQIWNDIDNPVAFILDAPRVPGLPDFSIVPDNLKQELADGIGISVDDIVSIVNCYEDLIPGGDSLEKYSVEYRGDNNIVIIQNLYRSPETNGFIPLEEELNNYF